MARPRAFDEQRLLDAALEQFWTKGYSRTVIGDIATESGVGNGSIYAAYGDKRGLFLAVFTRYCERKVALVDDIVSAHEGGFEDAVEHYLREIIVDCTSHPDQRGCLLINSLAELSAHEPEVARIGAEANTAMARRISDRVALGVEQGELDLTESEVDAMGELILLISQGLVNLSRTGASLERMRDIATTSSRMSSLVRAA